MSKLNPTYIGLEASLLIFFEKKNRAINLIQEEVWWLKDLTCDMYEILQG